MWQIIMERLDTKSTRTAIALIVGLLGLHWSPELVDAANTSIGELIQLVLAVIAAIKLYQKDRK